MKDLLQIAEKIYPYITSTNERYVGSVKIKYTSKIAQKINTKDKKNVRGIYMDQNEIY